MSDPQLPVDPPKVGSNGVDAHEQLPRDLRVGLALGNQLGDLALGSCEGERGGWPSADPIEFVASSGRPQGRSQLQEYAERLLERCSCRLLLFRSPLYLTLDQERAGTVERLWHELVLFHRSFEYLEGAEHIASFGEQEPADSGAPSRGPTANPATGLAPPSGARAHLLRRHARPL